MKHPDYDLIISFSQQLYLITATGEDITVALNLLLETCDDQKMKNLIKVITDSMDSTTLTAALEKTGIFDEHYLGVVDVGLVSGRLDSIFLYLSDYYQKEKDNRNLLSKTLSYPLTVTAVMVVVLVILATRALPIFNSIYQSIGSQLSGIGKYSLYFGYFINDYFIYILAIAAIGFILLVIMMRLGKLDFFKSIRLDQQTANDLYALYNLLKAGIILDEAVRLTFGPGVELDQVMANRLTPLELQLINVASNTGNFDQVLEILHKEYDRKTSTKIDRLVTTFEMSFIGGFTVIVAIILLSIILPLFTILINL